MDNIEKKDWFGLYYSNQDKTSEDFIRNGVEPSQLDLKPKDEYVKNPKIVQAFTNDAGEFDENAFNTFYNQALSSYNTLSQSKVLEDNLPTIQYDIMSPFKTREDKTQDITLDITKSKNPFVQTRGMSTILGTSSTKKSVREIAQQNLVFDTEHQVWMDKTPEDFGFWGTVTSTPIVLAQYDQDEESIDPETGRKVIHKKGELKLDDSGRPFYETLGNRNVHNRQVLSAFDVITREESTANKFDFFDNDGEEKSIGSTIAQTVATVIPMFIPYVGQAYAGTMILKEGTKLGITLYKMVDAFAGGNDKKDSDFGILNTIEAKMYQFDSSVSDKSQNNMFTFENFGRLASDVGSQLFQQRTLAQIPTWLGIGNPEKAAIKAIKSQYPKEIVDAISDGSIIKNETLYNEILLRNPAIRNTVKRAAVRNNILGRFMANFYMSGTSTMDVYNDALDAGYDRRTAALTAGLAMGATTWMIQSTEIGQKALQGLGFDSERATIREASKKFIAENRDELGLLAKDVSNNGRFNKLFRKAINTYKSVKEPISTVISSNAVMGSALAEGIEEVSEEAIMDMSKALTDVFTGITGSQKNASFNFLDSNPLERYAMSALGGAFGGTIFKLSSNFSDINNKIPKETRDNILYLIRNGKKDALISEFEKKRREGVASKTLSAIETETGLNGEIVYKPAKNGDSQNDAVIDLSIQLINEWDAIINEEGLNIDDEHLVELASIKDKRVQDLLTFDNRLDIIRDFNNLGNDISQLVLEKKDIENQLDAPNKNISNKSELEQRLNVINTELDQKRAEKLALLNGSKTEEYLKKALFNLSEISNPIYASDIYTYTRNILGRDYSTLSIAEKEDIQGRYKTYKEKSEVRFNEAYNIFNNITDKYGDRLLHISNHIPVLNKVKTYLSSMDEELLLSLDEEAKRQFDLNKRYGKELGFKTNQALDYILEYRNADLLEPFTNELVRKFFSDRFGVDFTQLIEESKNLPNLLNNISRELNNIGESFDAFSSDLIGRAQAYTGDIREFIQSELYSYIDNTTSSPTLNILLKNLVDNSNTGDANTTIKAFTNAISAFGNSISYELAPALRLSTIKKLSEAVNSGEFNITRDLYNYIRNYVKPDNEFELDAQQFSNDILLYLDESLIDLLESNLNNLNKDFIDSKAGNGVYEQIVKGFNNNLGIYNIEHFLQIFNQLKSAKSWFEVANILNSSGYNQDVKSLIVQNLNHANSKGTKSSTSELNTLIDPTIEESRVIDNPINDLLHDLYIDVEGSENPINIFDLLSNENNLLASSNTLSDYILQGKVKSDQIDSGINIIRALQAVISSMQTSTIGNTVYGYNSVINNLRDTLQISNKLPEIDSTIAYSTIQELESIISKLEFFKQLSEQNKGNKLKEHKLIAIHTRQALLNNFQDRLFTSKSPELFDGVDSIISEYNIEELSTSELSDDNYILLEELISKIEDKIYDNALYQEQTNSVSKQTLLSRLFSGLDYSKLMPEAYNNPKVLDSSIKEMSNTDLFIYYHTILAYKSSVFNKNLRDVISESLNSEDKLLIPLYSQEYAAKIILASIVDIDLMNHITELTKEAEESIINEEIRDKYNNLISTFKNLVFVNGAPGVGKTNGVGKLVYRLANKMLGTQGAIILGPEKQQSINLLNSLLNTNYTEQDNLEEINNTISKNKASVLTKDSLLGSILTSPEIIKTANEQFKEGNLKDYKGSERFIEKLKTNGENREDIYRLKRGYLSSQNFKMDSYPDQRLVFIDEITQFSKFELEILSAWAQLNNKVLITFGDLLQSGFAANNGLYLGLDVDTNLIYTPTISTSLRITNIHKKDNLDVLRTLTERVSDIRNYYTSGKLDYRKGIQNAASNYDNVPSLKYFEDDSVLHGEKIVTTLDEPTVVKLIKDSPDEQIGYIYDQEDSDGYKLVSNILNKFPDKIKRYKLDEVQGSEAKYFIIDLHLDYGRDNLKINKATRDLYTAVTRSKEGTIIIDNGLTSHLKKGSESVDYTQESVINNEAAKDFAALRLKSLNTIIPSIVEDITVTESKTEQSTTEAQTPEQENVKSSTSTNTTQHPNADLNTILGAAFDPSPQANREIEQLERKVGEVRKHPLDSFVTYSYRTRVKPKVVTSDGIETYSLKDSASIMRWDRNTEYRPFFNGEIEGINKADFERVDEKLLEIKSVLYNYKRDFRNKIFTDYGIEQSINDIFNDLTGNTGHLDLLNGKFVLKATKYIEKESGRENSIIRVIYNIPIINSSSDIHSIELYISELPDINNQNFRIKDTDSEEQKSSKAWFKEYERFYGDVMNSFSLDGKTKANAYVQLKDSFELDRITNLVVYKGSNRKEFRHIKYDDRDKEFKGLYFSKPYIVTNYKSLKENRNAVLLKHNQTISDLNSEISELTIQLSEANEAEQKSIQYKLDDLRRRLNAEHDRFTLKSRAVTFVTHSKYIFDEEGNIVPEDKWGDYYVNQINGEYDDNPDMRDKLRMIILNPEGQTFASFISKYREFINSYKRNSPTAKYSGKFYKSYFGDFIGFDILLSIYQYNNYIEARGKSDSKHGIIANKLLNSLQSLARKEGSIENPFDLPDKKIRFGLPHILRIMEKLHEETTPENIKKLENYASIINGNDVLKYLNKILEFKIEQRLHPEYVTHNPVQNTENGGLFFDWMKDDGVTDLDVIDFMEFALLGKRTYKNEDGTLREVVAPDYTPIFKDGIFPFPVFETTDKNTGYVSGEYFYEARNPEGEYYIDRDLQTPQFTFRPSRDLNNPNNIEVKESLTTTPTQSIIENEVQPQTTENTHTQTPETLRQNIGIATNDTITYLRDYISSSALPTTVSELILNSMQEFNIHENVKRTILQVYNGDVESYLSNLDSHLDDLLYPIFSYINDNLTEAHIPYSETTELDALKLNNGQIIVDTRKIEDKNNVDNISNSENNKLYLQSIYGDNFNIISDLSDIDTFSQITRKIENIDTSGTIIRFIALSEFNQDVLNIINNNPELKPLISDLNKIKSKYNIC